MADNVIQPGSRIGPYVVRRLLGHGGMGAVYEAEDASGARVALKLFTCDAKNREFLEKRFRAEAKLLAALDHPHLVKVHDVGVDAATGNPWFAMDLVLNAAGEPETLEDARRRGGISQEQALGWFHDLSDELVYLHSHGIVHRDVKLENVLVDASGHAVLSDFGISRIFDDGLRGRLDVTTTFIEGQTTGTRPVMGTYFYLAPEVRAGRAVTPAADWYALGVLFFRLLTGMWYEPPAARAEAGSQPSPSPFNLLLMFDKFWQTNLPRLLSDDQNTRTTVVFAGKRRSGWMRTLTVVCGLAALAAVAIAAFVGRDAFSRVRSAPKHPSRVLWFTSSGDVRGMDIGTVTSLVVKAACRDIPPNTFRRWPLLRHVEMEEGVESIGVAAFFGCPALETVSLPDSLERIDGYAFGDCFALREVRCGTGLREVGQATFGGCKSLRDVYFAGDAPLATGTRVYVRSPTNLVNHIKPSAKGWKNVWPPFDEFSRKVIRH